MNDEQSSNLFEQKESTGPDNEADDIEWLLGQLPSPNMAWDDSVLDLFQAPNDLDATTSTLSYTLDAVSSIAPLVTSEPEYLQKNLLSAGAHGVESRSISAIPGSVGDNNTPDLGATASCLANLEPLVFGADSSLDFGSIPIQSNLIDINTTSSIQDPKQLTETNIFQEQEAIPEVTVSLNTVNAIDPEYLPLTKPHTHRLDGGGFIDGNFSSISTNAPSQPPLLDEAITSSQPQIAAQTLLSQEPSQYSKYPQLPEELTTDKLLSELLSPHPNPFIVEANNAGSSSTKASSRNISQNYESISKAADNDLPLSKRKLEGGHAEQANKVRKPSPHHASHSNPVPPVLTHVTLPQEAFTYQQPPNQTMLSQQQLPLPQQSQYQQPQHQVHRMEQQPQENKTQQGQQWSQEQNHNTWLQLQQQQQLSQHVEWQLKEHQKIQLQAQLQIQQLQQQRQQQQQQQLQLQQYRQYQQYQQYQQYLQLSQHQQCPQYPQYQQHQQYHQQLSQHQQQQLLQHQQQHQQQQHQQNQHKQRQKHPKSKEHKSKQQGLDCELHEQEIRNNLEEEEEEEEEEEGKERECEEEEEEEEKEAGGGGKRKREEEEEEEEGGSSNTRNHDQRKKKKKKIADSSHHRARNAFFMFRGFASRLFAKEPDPVLLAAAAAAAAVTAAESTSNGFSSRPSIVRKKMRQTSLSALAAKCWSFVCFKTCGREGCANCRMHSVFDQSANFLKLRETELERLMMFSIEPGSQSPTRIGSEGSNSDVCTIHSKALLDTNPEEFFNWKEFEALYKTCDQFKYFRENCLAPGEVMELEAFKQIWIKAEREHEIDFLEKAKTRIFGEKKRKRMSEDEKKKSPD